MLGECGSPAIKPRRSIWSLTGIHPPTEDTITMKHSIVAVICILLMTPALAPGQATQEKVDSAAIARIKEEGLKNSQVMDLLVYLCDVYGPRLAWSPEYKKSADWASKKLREWGLQNVGYDKWAPMGKGWTLKLFSAMVTAPIPYPVIAYPSAWSPGFKEKDAEVVFLDVKKMEDLENYKGKLKGKYVLMNDLQDVKAHFDPQANRLEDSVLLRMANADLPGGRRGRRPPFQRMNAQNIDSVIAAARQMGVEIDSAAMVRRFQEMQMNPRKLEFALKEGAIAAITAGRGDDGTVLVAAATVPQPPETPRGQRLSPYDPKAPEIIPQIVFAAEHYNRILRMLQKGEKVKLEMELQVATTKPDSGFNIIGEIPGTDLKDEVVMLGAHFDSWHSGTGATDNATGTATCMEAVRILQVLAKQYDMKPRRTIRIGLWGAEEEGLIGSREYVSEVFAKRAGSPGTGPVAGGAGAGLTKMPEYEKLSVYFNHDNGTGRIRGVYMQGNEATRPIFRSWLTAYGDPAAQTLTIQNTGGTDHLSFDGVGLPGFQFIQDPIDYDSRTHHYNMDVYDRIQEADMKQAATIMATFVYNAAMRDAKFPRKPAQGSGGR
jgi:carboxypeptidase Q